MASQRCHDSHFTQRLQCSIKRHQAGGIVAVIISDQEPHGSSFVWKPGCHLWTNGKHRQEYSPVRLRKHLPGHLPGVGTHCAGISNLKLEISNCCEPKGGRGRNCRKTRLPNQSLSHVRLKHRTSCEKIRSKLLVWPLQRQRFVAALVKADG